MQKIGVRSISRLNSVTSLIRSLLDSQRIILKINISNLLNCVNVTFCGIIHAPKKKRVWTLDIYFVLTTEPIV